jgi:trigger factor
VKATVEPQEGNKVKLSIEIDEQEFEKAVDAAFKKIAREVRMPGFRPGKAPRRLLESRLGSGAGRSQALNDALPEYYSDAVRDHEVDVIAPPEINITSGEESGPVVFEAVVEVRPVISLDGYRQLSITVPSPSVDDDEIDAQFERVRNQYADLEVAERSAAEGDYVTIDIEGSQNDEVLEGLVASAYVYEVGSGAIVPALDEQLVGAAAGDTRSFDAPHPNAEEGEEPLHFEVTVTEVKVKVLPDLDDSLAIEASEFESLADWRADLVRRMTQVKRAQTQMAVREKIGEALAELVVDEVPEQLVAAEMQERLQDMAMRLEAQGLSLDQWLQFSGTEPDQFIADLRQTAERSARVDLALRAIALAESIEATEDDLELEFDAVAQRVEQDIDVVRSQLTEAGHLPALRTDVAKRKSLDWLTETVAIVDEAGVSISFADLAIDEDDDFIANIIESDTAEAEAEASTPTEEG